MRGSGFQNKWPLVKLADCARIVSGATPKTTEPQYWGGDINWVTPKDISNLDGYPFLNSTQRTLTAAGLASCSAEILPPNSVLLSSRAPIGLVAINRIPVATNQGFKSFLPDTSQLDAAFLYQWLKANRSLLEHLGTGATFKEVSKAAMTRVQIPLPPLDEQKRIAALLDKADSLCRKRQESLQITETLLQSVFFDIFGDPVTNPKGWKTESLTKACRLASGGTPSKGNPSYWEGDLPWFTPKDLKRDELFDSIDHVSKSALTQANLNLFLPDTVLIVVRGMILAHSFPVSVIKKAGAVNQDIKALTPVANVHPQFLAACLRSQRSLILTKVTTAGHGTKKLDTEGLAEIRIFLPPMRLQMQFIALVDRHRELLENGFNSAQNVYSLYSSLQQLAFRGKLNLSRIILEVQAETSGTHSDKPNRLATTVLPRMSKHGSLAKAFQPSAAIQRKLAKLDKLVKTGELINWSREYFRYRILPSLGTPFTFENVISQVKKIYEEPPYDDIRDILFELLGDSKEPPTLKQTFDTPNIKGSKEIPVSRQIIFDVII